MKKLMTLAVMIATIITVPVAAQDYAADIQKALKVFEAPKLQLNVEINVYAGASSQEIVQQYSAELKKDGTKFYSVMEGTRMLLNDKYLVMVYDADHRVICTERDKKSEKKMKGGTDPSAQIDSLLKKNDSIVYKGIVDHAKVYAIYTSKAMIQRTEIHLNEKTGNISSIVYFYNVKLVPVGSKVQVNYTINTAPVFASNEFSEKRFVIFGRGSEVTAGAECTNYQVTYIDPETATPTQK
jgi:hypothetical protein